MASSTLGSSPKFTVISLVCTTPPFRSESFLRQKYEIEKLSARQIAILIGCSHTVINNALIRYGVRKLNQRSGWVEYGWKIKFGKRVPHARQQTTIKQMLRWRTQGWTYKKIAKRLSDRKVPTPTGTDIWYGSNIRRIILRWT